MTKEHACVQISSLPVEKKIGAKWKSTNGATEGVGEWLDNGDDLKTTMPFHDLGLKFFTQN